jgi:hypothetical protein
MAGRVLIGHVEKGSYAGGRHSLHFLSFLGRSSAVMLSYKDRQHAFGYTLDEQLTIWSLTLPQVAATLAATLVAHETLGAAGQRLLDDRMLNVVLVLVFATSILGPVLTDRFASRLAAVAPAPN